MSIHKDYLKLTNRERGLADFTLDFAFDLARKHNIPLNGGDPAELVAEALAAWIIKSRKESAQ